ncbi:hypothetical protein NNJEOMEG_01473 [Fundidesulfovibrio magnetotacticus]|uniref:Surface antigen domain-containing protein n=1 Tax=Fundidesulfovibrio magnetotacticus TaxID=2730080 RepID=A0A6V8LU56_9BACT|nr:RT0821/Lpp0805 family surface protein [Fundidesulfovibrio magnetotacticus]GFK93639.1 hypothetical protein NNJEOMEG_01473 [Fundidesulfovibrio magnetotacticus]
MTYRAIALTLLTVLALSACADDQTIRKRDVGIVAGAAGGAIAGGAIGGNDPAGRVMGTLAGAIIGGAVGGYLGSVWDDYDRRQAASALENNRDYRATTWRNPNTGRESTMQPVRTYYDQGAPCREYTQTVIIDGRKETVRGTACRQADGTWRINN